MHRFLPRPVRRPKPLSTLALGLLAGAAVSSLPHVARAIGDLGAQATATSNRDVVAAEPAITLFGESSRLSSTAGESAPADATNRAPTRRRETVSRPEREERESARPRRRREVVEEEVSSDGKAAASKPVIESAAVSPWKFTLNAGVSSRYIHHGTDVVATFSNSGGSPFGNFFTNGIFTIGGQRFGNYEGVIRFGRGGDPNVADNPSKTQPVSFYNIGVEYKGFHASFGYVRAFGDTAPFYTNFVRYWNSPDAAIVSERRTYEEFTLNLDYTVEIFRKLQATVGLNSFYIPNAGFRGIKYQGEAFGRLAYTGIPYVTPSVTYYRTFAARSRRSYPADFSFYNGIVPPNGNDSIRVAENYDANIVDFRLDGNLTVFRRSNFTVTLAPFVQATYTDHYLDKITYFQGTVTPPPDLSRNGINTRNYSGFSSVEIGLKTPVQVGKHLTVTPFVTYGFDVSDNKSANAFRDDENKVINTAEYSGRSSVSNPSRTTVYGGVNVAWTF